MRGWGFCLEQERSPTTLKESPFRPKTIHDVSLTGCFAVIVPRWHPSASNFTVHITYLVGSRHEGYGESDSDDDF